MRVIKYLLPLLLLCLNCGTVDHTMEVNASGAGGVSGDSSVGGQNVGGLAGNSDVDCHRDWCDSKSHECHSCHQ